MLSQLARTVRAARDGLDAYDATGAGRHIERFVDDLSNWYVRRSRRRFWNPGGEASDDAAAAFHTLYECLVTLATLLAPVHAVHRRDACGATSPRTATAARRRCTSPTTRRSTRTRSTTALDAAMSAARSIVGLGRTVRTETKTRVRQPLAEAVVHLPGSFAGLEPLLDVVADELNVQRVVFAESAESFGRWHAKPNFRALGPTLGPRVKEVAAALADDDGSLAGGSQAALRSRSRPRRATCASEPDDVDLSQDVREGWGVASDGAASRWRSICTSPTTFAARASPASWSEPCRMHGSRPGSRSPIASSSASTAGPVVTEALSAHRDTVAGETLAVDVIHGEVEGPVVETEIDGEAVRISLRRAAYASPAGA